MRSAISLVSVVFRFEFEGLAGQSESDPVSVRSESDPMIVRTIGIDPMVFERRFATNSARGRHSESRSADSCGRGLGPDARCPGLQQFMIAKDELGARVLRRSPLRRTPVAPSAQWQDHARRSQVKHPEKQTTMKHALIAVLATLTVALPAEASEKPSRADMLKGLIVVGVYSRICPAPLSEAAKAETLAILRMFGELDSDWLEWYTDSRR